MVAWEQQRQGPPGQATDAEMIVLFHSFKAKMGHSTPRYKAALEEKIQRYRASPVSRIGRDKAYATRDANVTDVGHGGMTTRDTKVVWVQFSEDLPPELYYYKLDASPRQNDHTRGHKLVRSSGGLTVVETLTEPVRDAEQLLERARLERRLAELVLELDEPFRTTVLLRYREGLSAEAIAKHQGIPAATVRSRLKTALDRLRDELDDGEHKKSHALFGPLVPGVRPASTLWGIVMAKMTSKIGSAGATEPTN